MKKYPYFWLFLAIIILIFIFMVGCSSSGTGSEYVEIVQNSYLGEYTDIAVKDLLSGHYSLMYDKETWRGGTTDAGKEIVEVKYQNSNELMDDVTIQFTMLDEQCFEVSAFVDPWETIEKSTDLLAVLNYIYFEQYAIQNEAQVGSLEFELALIERLEQISASAVLYGASSEYSGERSQICTLADTTPLDVSVPLLLDNYGLLDLSYYYPDNFTSGSNGDIIIDTELYTITLPADWEGRYYYEQWETEGYGYALGLYEQQSYDDGCGGNLFSIVLLPDSLDYTEYPGYVYIGALSIVRLANYQVLVAYPTDVQFSDVGMENYIDMSEDIDSILATLTVQPSVDGTYTAVS